MKYTCYRFKREYPSGDGAVLIKQLPQVRFLPLVFPPSLVPYRLSGMAAAMGGTWLHSQVVKTRLFHRRNARFDSGWSHFPTKQNIQPARRVL